MSSSPMRIVLVDDDEDDRQFFIDALKELDMNTSLQVFQNGQDVLDFLSKENVERPDLVFLDLNMPVMNGFQCLREIRKKSALKELVVAIYSTSSSEKDVEETFVHGANIYINKPNKFDELKKILSQVIKRNTQYRENQMEKANFLFRL